MFFLLNGAFLGREDYSTGRLYFITKREKSKIKGIRESRSKKCRKKYDKKSVKEKCISSRQKKRQ